MKKVFGFAVAAALTLACTGVTAFASDDTLSAEVYVTISKQGELVAAQEKVSVSDSDDDGALTVNDALYALHESVYDGGAEAGYNSYYGDYGLSLGMLWGDNSGNFGYYKNNTSCMSLADTVAQGDYVTAFIYTDTAYYSDMYTFFDVNTVSAQAGDEITLTLSGAGYDENWNPVTLPVEGAEITVNGEPTGFVTDADGKVVITVDSEGSYTISAQSNAQTIVPPVCIADISAVQEEIEEAPEEEVPSESESMSESESVSQSENTQSSEESSESSVSSPETGERFNASVVALVLVFSVMASIAAISSAKKNYEK